MAPAGHRLFSEELPGEAAMSALLPDPARI
jgi:hypothetical protein